MRRRPCRKHRKAALQILSWRESAARVALLAAAAKPAREESFTHCLTSCSSFALLILCLSISCADVQPSQGTWRKMDPSSPASPWRVLAPCWRDLSGSKCSHYHQGTISSLHGERDDNTVVHIGNPRGGIGRFLRCFFLRVGTDRSPQDDRAALQLKHLPIDFQQVVDVSGVVFDPRCFFYDVWVVANKGEIQHDSRYSLLIPTAQAEGFTGRFDKKAP